MTGYTSHKDSAVVVHNDVEENRRRAGASGLVAEELGSGRFWSARSVGVAVGLVLVSTGHQSLMPRSATTAFVRLCAETSEVMKPVVLNFSMPGSIAARNLDAEALNP